MVATGGLSIPKIGATSFGYDLARQFGLAIREPWPGLVPLTLSKQDCDRYCDLAGVSAEVIASCNGQQFREKMLITHHGLSGPAILQISSYWKQSRADPDRSRARTARSPPHFAIQRRREIEARFEPNCRKLLAHRLADRWLEAHAPTSWTNPALADLEKQTHVWSITPAGTEGYEKAEVTAGGVDTNELSAKTMETSKVPGLFFIGEVVDVTGHLGGFNFQWAWASGAAAGRAL